MIEGGEKVFFDKLSQKNRFNSSLLSDIQNKGASGVKAQDRGPDPLFGAISRM